MSRAQSGSRVQALWFSVFWLAVGIGSYVLGVRNELGQQAENSVLDAAQYSTTPPAPLNLVSIESTGIAIIAVGIIAFFAHGIRRAFVVTIVPAAAIVASQLLKQQLLTRPQLFELDLPNTFPSGHMTVFAAVCAALIWAVPTRIRAFVAVGATALLGAVGWQLLGYGWHRPSDVFGGLALATCAFSLACVIQPATTRGVPVLGRTLSIGLVLFGWALIGAALVLATLAFGSSSSALMLSSGQFGGFGMSALAAQALFRLSSGS